VPVYRGWESWDSLLLGWRRVTTQQQILDQQRKEGEKNDQHGWEQNPSMKQLWWDWWKEREDISTGAQVLDSG